MAFELLALPYAYDALEPFIDARTMEIHHTKHHQAYVTNLNNAVKDTAFAALSLADLLANESALAVPAIRNNAGGHWNHGFFWSILAKNVAMPAQLTAALAKNFGDVENFKAQFKAKALTVFGSGWAWLCQKSDGSLHLVGTPNQDNPLMPFYKDAGRPIFGVDVWEHAYYLHYQNRRADYLDAVFNALDWAKIAQELR